MRKLSTILLLAVSSISFGQTAEVIKFDTLRTLLDRRSGKVQVINFWATWCAPCVKELPLFEKLNQERPDVKVTLVSLDFSEKVDKVNSFLARKEMKSTVLLLDEVDYNKWIDQVHKDWTGAIPATLIINPSNGKRTFIEKELHDGDLEKLISEVLETL